jgi:carbamoyl-phosphate synthase large subunit
VHQRRFNILVSSAGRRVALLRLLREALDALGVAGSVFAADTQRASSAFQLADRSFVVPPCAHPEFLPHLVDLCRRNDVRLVVPTIDVELGAWASVRDACFDHDGMVVAVSSPKVIEIAADKVETNCWLRDNGFPTTDQFGPEGFDEPHTGLEFPVIVKPRRGSASTGVGVARDLEGLRAMVTPDDVVEAIAPGTEYTIDVLVGRDGITRCAVPRRRVEVRAGEVSKAVVERDGELTALATDIGDALPGAYGVLNIQVMRDERSGDCRVIEINPRFGGGYPLTSMAGGRLHVWLLEEILGRPSSQPDAVWRDGLAMLRYDDAIYVDASLAGLDRA